MSYKPPKIELSPPDSETKSHKKPGSSPKNRPGSKGGKKRPASKERGRPNSKGSTGSTGDRPRSKEKRPNSKGSGKKNNTNRSASKPRTPNKSPKGKTKTQTKSNVSSKKSQSAKKPRETHGTSRVKPNPNPRKMHRKLQMATVDNNDGTKSSTKNKDVGSSQESSKKNQKNGSSIKQDSIPKPSDEKLAKARSSLLGNLGKAIKFGHKNDGPVKFLFLFLLLCFLFLFLCLCNFLACFATVFE